MAWGIVLDGVFQRLSLSANISLAGDFSLTVANIKASATTTAEGFQAITGTLDGFENFIAARTSEWYIRISNNNYTIPFTTVKEPTTRGDMTAVRVGNQLTFGFGGDLTTITVTTAAFVVGCFGMIKATAPSTTHSFGGELGDVTLGTTNLWDATVSDHSNGGGGSPYPQPIIIDTIGGNNATGVGFPTNKLTYWYDIDNTYGCTITVEPAKITGSVSGLVWLFTESNFEESNAVGAIDGSSQSILNGGGNLRCYTDSTKATQLPIHVVTFQTGGTPKVLVYGRSASLAVGGTVYIEADATATVQPLPNNAYGQYGVYADELYSSLDGGVTEVSNDHTMVDDGTGAVVVGRFPSMVAVASPKQRLLDETVGDKTDNFTLSMWHKGQTVGTLISRRDGSTTQYQAYTTDGGRDYALLDSSSSNVFADNAVAGNIAWFKVDYVFSGGTCSVYANGVYSNQHNVTVNSKSTIPLRIGCRGNGGLGSVGYAYAGTVGENSVSDYAKDASVIEAEFNNQSAPSTFWSTSAWEPQTGGEPLLISVTSALGVFSSLLDSVSRGYTVTASVLAEVASEVSNSSVLSSSVLGEILKSSDSTTSVLEVVQEAAGVVSSSLESVQDSLSVPASTLGWQSNYVGVVSSSLTSLDSVLNVESSALGSTQGAVSPDVGVLGAVANQASPKSSVLSFVNSGVSLVSSALEAVIAGVHNSVGLVSNVLTYTEKSVEGASSVLGAVESEVVSSSSLLGTVASNNALNSSLFNSVTNSAIIASTGLGRVTRNVESVSSTFGTVNGSASSETSVLGSVSESTSMSFGILYSVSGGVTLSYYVEGILVSSDFSKPFSLYSGSVVGYALSEEQDGGFTII